MLGFYIKTLRIEIEVELYGYLLPEGNIEGSNMVDMVLSKMDHLTDPEP